MWHFESCSTSRYCTVNKNKIKIQSVTVLKTEQCARQNQYNFLNTGVILVYLLIFKTILDAVFWLLCRFMYITLGETPEK